MAEILQKKQIYVQVHKFFLGFHKKYKPIHKTSYKGLNFTVFIFVPGLHDDL